MSEVKIISLLGDKNNLMLFNIGPESNTPKESVVRKFWLLYRAVSNTTASCSTWLLGDNKVVAR